MLHNGLGLFVLWDTYHRRDEYIETSIACLYQDHEFFADTGVVVRLATGWGIEAILMGFLWLKCLHVQL